MIKPYTVTVFKSISATSTPFFRDVTVVLERIKTGKDLVLINQIRLEKEKSKRNEFKKQLPSICFSGKFRQRSAINLIQHSGLICLDFDGFKDEAELLLYKKALCESPEKAKYSLAVFISPSGDGLKVLVKIPPSAKDHKSYFVALKEFYDNSHFDIACSDICRVCYSSYDEHLYYNPDSEVWVEMEANEHYELANHAPVLKLRSEINIVANLRKWFDKNFQMVTGEKNNNLFKLASAFNDFGLSKHVCEQYMTSQFGDKKTEREILNVVKSAYKKEGGTKCFEDKQSLELLERQIRSGMDRKKIFKKMLDENKHSEEDVENAIKSISDSMPISEFWYWTDKGVCKIKNFKYKLFLEQNGFYKYYPEGAENFIFIRIENNMIENTSPDVIKNFTLKYLEQQSSLDPYEAMAGSAKMFKDDYLNLIDVADITFYEDTQDKGVVYFKNGAAIVKTTATETEEETPLGKKMNTTKSTKIELVDYMSLNGYVWKKHIIDREYEPVFKEVTTEVDGVPTQVKVEADVTECVYSKFIDLIGGKNADKILSIRSTIGYLMHSFKTSANNKAVILNDETISDNPNGGSGKGVFCAALGHMKRLAILNGKTFDGAKSFAYQTVGADTQILVYDDIPKNFAFENLFSVVTEGITLEKKNKDAIKLSVGRSPKIIITTNYTIGGVGGSFERRKLELEFSAHFSSLWTPLMEFGHLLFDEWSEAEWKRFDSFMIDCLRIYLEQGIVKQDFTNLAERKFIKETSFEFYEWVNDEPLALHIQLTKPSLYDRFLAEYPDYKINKWFSQKRFYGWLLMYAKYKHHKVLDGKSLDGRWIMFIPDGEAVKKAEDLSVMDDKSVGVVVAKVTEEEDEPF